MCNFYRNIPYCSGPVAISGFFLLMFFFVLFLVFFFFFVFPFFFLQRHYLAKEMWHLSSPLARSCQYLSVCQNNQTIPNGLSAIAIFATDHGRTDRRTHGLTK